jgi:Asp/Glu/hydantoin racemase
MKILFLNQAPEDPSGDDRKEEITRLLNSYASETTDIELGYPDDYPGAKVKSKLSSQKGYNGLHHAMEIAPIIRKTAWAEKEGYDAVIQSCTFDPGVEEARLAVNIPVIGLFRTALQVVANLAYKIGVIVPLPGHVGETWRRLYRYRMSQFITDVRAHNAYGDDMAQRENEIFDKTVDQIRRVADETGAEYIIPLGGALIPYIVSPNELSEAANIPVINTKAVAIRFTEMCVDLNMAQSNVAYPKGELEYEDFVSKLAE